MGKYYGVAKIQKFGTRIAEYYSAELELYHVVAILDNGQYQVALDVTDREEYDSAMQIYNSSIHIVSLYEVPTGQIDNCYDVDYD